MHITFSAKGNNAEKISWFLGKNPDSNFARETKYGIVEFKYIDYSENFVKAFITFHPDGLSMIKESEFNGLDSYINDREFSVSTIFLSNIRNSIGHVLSYNYKDIDLKFDFEFEIGPISTNLPNDVILELFQPLGYIVEINKIQSEYDFNIDSGNVIELKIKNNSDIVSIFRHIYVLLPIIDNYKHHFISDEEVDKLLRLGEGWLVNHPKNEFISKRYVGYKQVMFRNVMNELEKEKEKIEKNIQENEEINENEIEEEKLGLGVLRYKAFATHIDNLNIEEVVDMGAGEGRLIELLAESNKIKTIIACEPTEKGRRIMRERIEKWTRYRNIKVKPRVVQSSLFYKDETLNNKECITLCEVIEHINSNRIDEVMNIILGYNKPKYFLISTPNFEYNVLYKNMKTKFRHKDHRFEMTRNEFQTFINKHAKKNNYEVEFIGIGELSEEFGYPTQMAIMKRKEND